MDARLSPTLATGVAQLPRLSARWLPAASRPQQMCGLRTPLQTNVDPYHLAAAGESCLIFFAVYEFRLWHFDIGAVDLQ